MAPVHPYPHVLSRNEKCIAVMAELATELLIDPEPLAHGNLPCNCNIAITPFGMVAKRKVRLLKKNFNTFPCNLFCHGISGSFCHGILPAPGLCYTISVRHKKAAGSSSL